MSKERKCSYEGCAVRRPHRERPDEFRGAIVMMVPDNYPDEHPAYCSYTCGLMDGWLIMTYETPEQKTIRQSEWLRKK